MKTRQKNKPFIKNTAIFCIICIACLILTALFYKLHNVYNIGVFYALSITAFTTLYHFAMRMIVGSAVSVIFRKGINYQSIWFSPRKFERKLYKTLRVKRWKGKMFTFNPDLFSLKTHSAEQVIMEMCKAETVHEVIVVFSFVPLFFALAVGDFAVFLITSILASFFDMIFVIIQRYNRPRIVKLLHITEHKPHDPI